MSLIRGLLSRVAKAVREPMLGNGLLRRNRMRAASTLALLALMPLLAGCQVALLDPKGPIGDDEKWLMLVATGLMLIVVIPVILMTLWFAWRYRASNTAATYRPNWEHSTRIELVVWLVPCMIIIALGTLTWIYSHRLDPYRPIASSEKPLEVQVVSLDWKWLFIYPEQGVATVNELAMPVNRPVHFNITSSGVMNAFFIPDLGSMIYSMAGMNTQLSLLADEVGTYRGISANYSGAGFSGMHFETKVLDAADFDKWFEDVRSTQGKLDLATYQQLVKPSENNPVTFYASVAPSMFHDILNKCTDGSVCTDAAMNMAMAKELGSGGPLCTPENPKGL